MLVKWHYWYSTCQAVRAQGRIAHVKANNKLETYKNSCFLGQKKQIHTRNARHSIQYQHAKKIKNMFPEYN